ncbi:FAD-binding oxidoreductase [Pseudomonas sp. MAFF212428]|uniref:FAD-binding oxidoreductase n=1 Tax=Pseudomonas brassicae TaxID=2708063 RepID=A0A6B3NW25_9PSED|nr:FAD-binding oxidoreductase [Pseudomonas brassicae]NER59267.1 FAD-binding oxidoreductase [Pseudomonas brassicae]NER66299.1 FAD-binding oxidoreductase [Pseudomonas brassicae]
MTDLRQECLWEFVTPPAAPAAALAAEIKADVCVIGGGITGLSAAIHLLEQGKSVVLLEARAIGHGGSGRNVGLVNAGTWIRPDDVEATLGQQQGSRLNKVLGEAPAEVFALIKRLGIDCQARNEGTLHMAHNASGVADLQSRHQQWSRRGADVQLLTGAQCQEYCGTDKISAALLDRRAGTLNPMGYTRGLAAAVRRLGGQLFEQSGVTGLAREGSGWQVKTAQGAVSADKVVISTGAYTEGDWTDLQKHYFRGYYYQVASTPLQGAAADNVLKHGQGSWDTRTVLSSIRRDDQGRLLLGSMGRVDNKPAWFVRSWADRIQSHYFPQLGKVDWEMHWTGCIDFTPDHLMRLFEPAPGIVAVTGYNGRGNTTGTVIGKAFAQYLLQDNPDALPIPFAPMKPVSAPLLRTGVYETGFSLYHAGQCLRVLL